MKPALLIIDPQNDFFVDQNPNRAEFDATIPVINGAIRIARENGWPVIFVQQSSSGKPTGSLKWEIYEKFNCKHGDYHINKTFYNAFWNTKLGGILKANSIDYVIVTGYNSEYCVLSTLRGALERGYNGAILEQGIASLDKNGTTYVLEISPHISLSALKAIQV